VTLLTAELTRSSNHHLLSPLEAVSGPLGSISRENVPTTPTRSSALGFICYPPSRYACSLVRSLHLSLSLSLFSRALPCPASRTHYRLIPVLSSPARSGSPHLMFAPALLLSRSTQSKRQTWVAIMTFLFFIIHLPY